MRRRDVLAALAGGGGLASRVVLHGSDGTGEDLAPANTPTPTGSPDCTYHNPVYEERVVPDPSVVRTPEDTYYAYGTYNVWDPAKDRPLVAVLRSRNLADWTYVGEAFDERPDWKDGGVWAPDVARIDGRYVCYYSLAHWGDPNPGIGAAAAETPEGPFGDRGKLLRSDEVGVENSIDPFVVPGGDRPTLYWGSHHGIYAAPLAPDGLSLAGAPERIAGGDVEAACVVEREGSYYLLVSTGTCCKGARSTYHVLAGRADSLTDTYVDADGTELSAGSGELVVEGGDRFAGPGHCDVATDGAGDDWLVHHGYERSNAWTGVTPRRVLFVSPIEWRVGWPVVPGRTPPAEAACPESRG